MNSGNVGKGGGEREAHKEAADKSRIKHYRDKSLKETKEHRCFLSFLFTVFLVNIVSQMSIHPSDQTSHAEPAISLETTGKMITALNISTTYN